MIDESDESDESEEAEDIDEIEAEKRHNEGLRWPR